MSSRIACGVVVLLLAACQSQLVPSDAVHSSDPGTEGGKAFVIREPTLLSSIFVQEIGDRVFFASSKANLSSSARQTLKRQADFLKRYPLLKVTITGHCDERGSIAYNRRLGKRRANAVMSYLLQLGISRGRLRTISAGKQRPQVLGHTETALAQNRTVVSVLE